MNTLQVRAFVRQIIAEAKEKTKQPKKDVKKPLKKEEKLPKSSGKLVDLKRELAALKQMKDELQTAKFAEKTASTEVEFADLQKFAAELDKIKQGGVALEQKIDARLSELEGIIASEKNKIKEMIGLAPKQNQEKIVDEGNEEEKLEESNNGFGDGGPGFYINDKEHNDPKNFDKWQEKFLAVAKKRRDDRIAATKANLPTSDDLPFGGKKSKLKK